MDKEDNKCVWETVSDLSEDEKIQHYEYQENYLDNHDT